MSTSSESRPWPAEAARGALVAAALAILLFTGAWTLLHHGFYTHSEITDLPVYERYGDAVVGGAVPYRDFGLEYPPAAVPAFVIPSLGNRGDSAAYGRAFDVEMWVCGALLVLACAVALGCLRAPPTRLALALAFIALAPLLLGSTVRLRFDLWPALLTVAAVAALLAERRILALALLGVAVAAKLYPAVLVPLALAYLWRRRGGQGLREGLCAFVAAAAACLLPFLFLAPSGLLASFTRQTSRPLQIESLGSALLLAAHQVAGVHLALVTSHGSQNLAGGAAAALAIVTTVLQAAALVVLWVWFARGAATRERFVRYAAACVCAFIAFGKVLSPQFLIWLLPLVPLVRGRRGAAAAVLYAVVLVLTQLWFPYRYWSLALSFAPTESWLVLARDVGLVALAVLLTYETPTRTASHELARPS